ncbi:hypothetical protein Micbo1qcDRAFT_158499 [Microdochium bolleyi]|uniref:Secreted protein n=1 Tax=Microdochium bolleyi TaxID=196109 RepID=A0A136J902_9PEZI|nr:hypothetical protein Micbo1qcDRAFT_158499 [Microdochium bolleyi]
MDSRLFWHCCLRLTLLPSSFCAAASGVFQPNLHLAFSQLESPSRSLQAYTSVQPREGSLPCGPLASSFVTCRSWDVPVAREGTELECLESIDRVASSVP